MWKSESSFIYWFIPDMPITACVGPDQSKEPETSSESPSCMGGKDLSTY